MPRMELLAAVIGARLKKTIIQEHSLHIAKTFMWSDSSTVLSWIRSDVRRYRQYVAFRVNEILNLTTIDEWNWVPTRLNVADEATKWGKGPSFNCDSRWFNAPEYLYTPEGEWPIQERLEPVSEVVQELRPAFVNTHVKKEPLIDLHRFSKWERLLRSIAYVHCFLEFIPQRKRLGTLPKTKLTSEHIKKAERTLWRLAQMDGFPDEVAVFKHNQRTSISTKWPLDKSSSIFNLSPIMDELEVIRQDGRMQAARWMSQDAKYPIILPRNHRITYLLIDWYHRQYRHANEETVVNEIRQRFRVPRLRVQLQLTKKACMWCRVYKSTPKVPRMGPLPRVRLTPLVRPFTFTGIDYFGPYLIKVGRSAVKRWAVLFTCLTVRAIHLEVAASLTTDSCKKAIRRFIARRGAPEEIYSDHGTNFQGARRELREEIKKLNEVLGSTFTDARTQWFFIPPAAPHMGGCWERMVRSVKTALAAIPINDKLDDESLMTFMAEAEHMINSRPLTFIPIRTECEESLTPNHFLMLGSKGVKQGIKEHVEMGKALRGSWNLIQSTLQIFWKKWTVSYLPTITRRTKWFENVRPIQQGELVVLVDENIRNRWLRGRVMQTYPGPDGVARQADILTSKGILKNRPFTKLALLDVGVHAAEPEIQTT
ncbi:uncharacterized protein LOC129757562 [Uranotaenia lowii]|nr:uncharacterized protein LOC129757562 [Uranotaenia lowii]